ncbi:MAG: hypothetical protein HQ561_14650 [Desulfobacteraceae bacterium]|nr:hypothetical protein [Desulfobacteraceae bacterium]
MMKSRIKDIGRQFAISKYSSVSRAIEKTKRDISADRKLKSRFKNIEKTLENSQKQITPWFVTLSWMDTS